MKAKVKLDYKMKAKKQQASNISSKKVSEICIVSKKLNKDITALNLFLPCLSEPVLIKTLLLSSKIHFSIVFKI